MSKSQPPIDNLAGLPLVKTLEFGIGCEAYIYGPVQVERKVCISVKFASGSRSLETPGVTVGTGWHRLRS